MTERPRGAHRWNGRGVGQPQRGGTKEKKGRSGACILPRPSPGPQEEDRKCKNCGHYTTVDNGARGILWCRKFQAEFNRNQPGCLEYEEKER